ncbi:MAG: DUF3343 domain-containing protein [Butyricicoccaceae bacterium]
MKAKEPTLVVTFANTPDAIAMEKFCQTNQLPGRLSPIPSVLQAGCGLAWRAPADQEAHFAQVMAENHVRYAAMQIVEL